MTMEVAEPAWEEVDVSFAWRPVAVAMLVGGLTLLHICRVHVDRWAEAWFNRLLGTDAAATNPPHVFPPMYILYVRGPRMSRIYLRCPDLMSAYLSRF